MMLLVFEWLLLVKTGVEHKLQKVFVSREGGFGLDYVYSQSKANQVCASRSRT